MVDGRKTGDISLKDSLHIQIETSLGKQHLGNGFGFYLRFSILASECSHEHLKAPIQKRNPSVQDRKLADPVKTARRFIRNSQIHTVE